MADYQEQAETRVDSTPELAEYRDEIVYDWPEGDEHWEWVATAPVAEIVDWAETIRRGAEKGREDTLTSLMTVAEAAERLGMNRTTVLRKAQRHGLGTAVGDRAYLLTEADLEALREDHRSR